MAFSYGTPELELMKGSQALLKPAVAFEDILKREGSPLPTLSALLSAWLQLELVLVKADPEVGETTELLPPSLAPLTRPMPMGWVLTLRKLLSDV